MCIYMYIFKSTNEGICTEFVSLCAEVSHHNHLFSWYAEFNGNVGTDQERKLCSQFLHQIFGCPAS